MNAKEMRARIAQLEEENKRLHKRCREQFDAHMEWMSDKREDRWHATRDAALTGILMRNELYQTAYNEATAATYADDIHGPLKPHKFPSAEVADESCSPAASQ